jgi:hypothetical protein
MDKQEFRRRLERAGQRARAFAAQYVVEHLPDALLYSLPPMDDHRGRRGPEGTIKYFGGRFIRPDDLRCIPAHRAADLLWVDGKVPAWINVCVTSATAEATHIGLLCSAKLVPAEESRLSRDIVTVPGDPIEPFRIRGPAVPEGWTSVRESGRVPLSQSSRRD